MKPAGAQKKSEIKQRLRLSHKAWRNLSAKMTASSVASSRRSRLPYSIAGLGNSLLGKLQSLSQAEALEKVEVRPPVFLLGFWRSGTTFLHEIFCCDSRFGFPTTYACLNPAHFLLTERWIHERARQLQTQRPMDNMLYSWDSPQEDEFALLCLGAPSPYEALLAPSLMRDPRHLLDLRCRPRAEQDRWQETFQLFLRLLTVQQHKPMLLKSPPHGFRLLRLSSFFPKARFVIIERNPYEVFASNLKLWKTLLNRYSLEPSVPEEIEEFVLAAYIIHEEAIAEGVRHLPPGTLSRVRYEDMVANPLSEMKRMYSELELEEFDAARPRLEEHIAKVSDYTRNRFVVSAEQKAAVDQRWGQIISEKGYDWTSASLGLTRSA
jgi:hypothetical protein